MSNPRISSRAKGERRSSWIVDCGDSMRLHFWNKRPKIDRLLKQLASYKSVLAREFQDQFFNYQQINYLPKFLVVVLHTLKTSACVNVYRASCMNTRSIFWCLFQKRSLMLSPILPFKKFSCLHSPCTKFSNLTNILWRTYFLIGEISFFATLRPESRKLAALISSISSEDV